MQIGFNTEAYDFYKGMELLQAGRYPVVIEEVIAERAKDPASGLLKITMAVAPGHQNAGRKLFYRLNLWNVNEDSKTIAHKQLKSLCYAVGIVGQLQDTDQLKGRQLQVDIDNNGTYNNIVKVYDMQGNQPGVTGAPQPGTPGQPGMPQFGSPAPAAPGGYPAPQPAIPSANPFGAPPAPPQAPPAPPPPPTVTAVDPRASWQRSPDGAWLLNPQTQQWEAVNQPAAPPAMPANPFQPPTAQPGGYQPQAPQASNPAQGFNPGAPAGPPAGWPS